MTGICPWATKSEMHTPIQSTANTLDALCFQDCHLKCIGCNNKTAHIKARRKLESRDDPPPPPFDLRSGSPSEPENNLITIMASKQNLTAKPSCQGHELTNTTFKIQPVVDFIPPIDGRSRFLDFLPLPMELRLCLCCAFWREWWCD